jgi:hypothetical protein
MRVVLLCAALGGVLATAAPVGTGDKHDTVALAGRGAGVRLSERRVRKDGDRRRSPDRPPLRAPTPAHRPGRLPRVAAGAGRPPRLQRRRRRFGRGEHSPGRCSRARTRRLLRAFGEGRSGLARAGRAATWECHRRPARLGRERPSRGSSHASARGRNRARDDRRAPPDLPKRRARALAARSHREDARPLRRDEGGGRIREQHALRRLRSRLSNRGGDLRVPAYAGRLPRLPDVVRHRPRDGRAGFLSGAGRHARLGSERLRLEQRIRRRRRERSPPRRRCRQHGRAASGSSWCSLPRGGERRSGCRRRPLGCMHEQHGRRTGHGSCTRGRGSDFACTGRPPAASANPR